MGAARYIWYRRLPRGAMHGGASHLFTILPVFVLHDICMYVRQDGKFSSNLLLLLISRTYQHILASGKSRVRSCVVYIPPCLCAPISVPVYHLRISTEANLDCSCENWWQHSID